jgi:hypothetical protein
VPQHTLGVLQRSVFLHVGAQRTPHYLKSDEAIWDA